MTVPEFIEKGMEGGWKPDWIRERTGETILYFYDSGELRTWIFWAMLQPELWKAVGKVEGWKEDTHYTDEGVRFRKGTNYVRNMHRMIDALAEGKTIEQYIETL